MFSNSLSALKIKALQSALGGSDRLKSKDPTRIKDTLREMGLSPTDEDIDLIVNSAISPTTDLSPPSALANGSSGARKTPAAKTTRFDSESKPHGTVSSAYQTPGQGLRMRYQELNPDDHSGENYSGEKDWMDWEADRQTSHGVQPYPDVNTCDIPSGTVPYKEGDGFRLYSLNDSWRNDTALFTWIQSVVSLVVGFDPCYPIHAKLDNGEAVQFSLQDDVPARYRLATLFLNEIGRDRDERAVKSSKGHYDYEEAGAEKNRDLPPLWNVKLTKPLEFLKNDVHINADKMDHFIRTAPKFRLERLDKPLKGRPLGPDGKLVKEKALDSEGKPIMEDGQPKMISKKRDYKVAHPRELYGNKSFDITKEEIRQLEHSVFIQTGRFLPPLFFSELAGILSRDDQVQFYYDRRSIPLDQYPISEPYCELASLVLKLQQKPEERERYGFKSAIHLALTLEQSFCELSTNVCIGQDGYFFVGAHNQICEKPEKPLFLVSAPGIDFNSGASARRENMKYFSEKSFLPDGRGRFKQRIKETYDNLFKSCQHAKVTHPTWIAMGLGIFLPAVEGSEVKRIYHEAQFELLSENDYGFEVYFLNPGPGTREARQLLDTFAYPFKCKVVLHSKDGKHMAVELSRQPNIKTSFLNPSDSIAMLQGRIGYWWEIGMGERYVGEEDFGATSTGILAHCNITTAYNHLDHIRHTEFQFSMKDAVAHDSFNASLPSGVATTQGSGGLRTAQPARNPPRGSLALHRWMVTPRGGGDKEIYEMYFSTIIWVDTARNHKYHLIPMINKMRHSGIRVIALESAKQVKDFLKDPEEHSISCVITNLYTRKANAKKAKSQPDTGHGLIKYLHWRRKKDQTLTYQIVVASTKAIDSSERSACYSEGADMVVFNVHKRHYFDLMDVLASIQRLNIHLATAVEQRSSKELNRLIKQGNDVNYIPKNWAPIHFAAELRGATDNVETCVEIAQKLVKAGANINTRTKYTTRAFPAASTPLHIAARQNNVKMVRALLALDADPHATNDDKETALDISRKLENDEVTIELEKHIARKLERNQAATPAVITVATSPPLITVLWVSTGEIDSCTRNLRLQLDMTGGMTVREISMPTNEAIDHSSFRQTVIQQMKEAGKEGLEWLACVVVELAANDGMSEAQAKANLSLWIGLVQDVVETISSLGKTVKEENSETGVCPWLEVIKFAPEQSALKLPARPDLHFMLDPTNPLNVVLNSAAQAQMSRKGSVADVVKKGARSKAQWKEWLCVKAGDDPMDSFHRKKGEEDEGRPAADGTYRLDHALRKATTHWCWDCADIGWDRNQAPYSALTSYKLETAYQLGKPFVEEGNYHIDLNNLVQQRKDSHLRMRLIYRYPIACLDVSKELRKHPHLISEIREGNCLIFLGAGYAVPSGGPSWAELLQNIAARAVEWQKDNKLLKAERRASQAGHEQCAIANDPEYNMEEMETEVRSLVADTSNHTNMELAAQLLEDGLNTEERPLGMNEMLIEVMKAATKTAKVMYERYEKSGGAEYMLMVTRLKTVHCIKFDACLTTNYTMELCSCKEAPLEKDQCYICRAMTPMGQHGKGGKQPAYMNFLRQSNRSKEERHRPTIQIHGSLADPKSIVLTREGYRRLLHDYPMYQDFLKSVMSSRTILYVGFSFTDDYLNEIRSDIMTMKKSSHMKNPLAYAIIPDKKPVHQEYYQTHEGVQFLSWQTSKFGFGIMDRYLDCILRMTDVGAALNASKVILFTGSGEEEEGSSAVGNRNSGQNSEMTQLYLELTKALNSRVFTDIPERYHQFQLRKVSTLHEVEADLKKEDFIHSYVIVAADSVSQWDELKNTPQMPSLHRELINVLWHPFSYFKNTMYPTTMLVLGSPPPSVMGTLGDMEKEVEMDRINLERYHLLRELYEVNLNVKFCDKAADVLKQFATISTNLPEEQTGEAVTDMSSMTSDKTDLDDLSEFMD